MEDYIMRIAIPSENGKLCSHFGHCEAFSIVDVDLSNGEMNIKTDAPEGGVSCHCAPWVAQQGVELVLAGGIGGRPAAALQELGIEVIAGCPAIEIDSLVRNYINNQLEVGENSCGHDDHHHCHGHGEGHHCGHNH